MAGLTRKIFYGGRRKSKTKRAQQAQRPKKAPSPQKAARAAAAKKAGLKRQKKFHADKKKFHADKKKGINPRKTKKDKKKAKKDARKTKKAAKKKAAKRAARKTQKKKPGRGAVIASGLGNIAAAVAGALGALAAAAAEAAKAAMELLAAGIGAAMDVAGKALDALMNGFDGPGSINAGPMTQEQKACREKAMACIKASNDTRNNSVKEFIEEKSIFSSEKDFNKNLLRAVVTADIQLMSSLNKCSPTLDECQSNKSSNKNNAQEKPEISANAA